MDNNYKIVVVIRYIKKILIVIDVAMMYNLGHL